MSKVIATGDVHFHLWNNHSRILANGYNSRLWYTHDRIRDMRQIGIENKVDAMFICGDLNHVKKLDGEVLDASARALSDFPFPIFGIFGNHDYSSHVNEVSSSRALSGKIDFLDKVNGQSREINKDVVYGISFLPSRELLKKEFKLVHKNTTFLLLHAGVIGAVMAEGYLADAEDCYTPQDVKGLAEIVISSHFHTPQIINISTEEVYKITGYVKVPYEPYNTILLPGAPEQHGFGDIGQERGCWIIDTDEKTLEFFPLASPKFIIADEKTDPKELKGNYVKYISKDNNPNLAYAENVIHEAPLDIKPVESHSYKLNLQDPLDKVLSEYVNHNPQNGLSNEKLMAEGKRLLCG